MYFAHLNFILSDLIIVEAVCDQEKIRGPVPLVSPNNHQQYCTNRRPVFLERKRLLHGLYPPYIVPETHPSTRTLPLSHNPLSSLFIFSQWVTVIYSQVSFSWVITGYWGGLGWLRLSSLVFHPAIISSNRGPSYWYASYALARHAAFASLLVFVERLLGSISGNGMSSFHRQLLALAVQATPAFSLVLMGLFLAVMMLVYNEVLGLVKY